MAPKTLAVFGGSGLTGRALIAAALAQGVRVQALYRPGSAPREAPQGLRATTGQLDDAKAVRQTLEGADGVVLVFGPRLGGLFSAPPEPPRPFCAPATASIVSQMKQLGIRRLVCQTGAMAGHGEPNWSRAVSRFVRRYRRRFPEVAADRDAQEQVVRESGLDWTLVKPFRISGAKGRGRVRASPAVRIGAFTSVPRDDLARFLVDEATGGRFHGEAVYAVKDTPARIPAPAAARETAAGKGPGTLRGRLDGR